MSKQSPNKNIVWNKVQQLELELTETIELLKQAVDWVKESDERLGRLEMHTAKHCAQIRTLNSGEKLAEEMETDESSPESSQEMSEEEFKKLNNAFVERLFTALTGKDPLDGPVKITIPLRK